MSCRSFRLLMAEAALAPPDRAVHQELAEHLRGCGACAAEVAALRETARLVGAARPEPSPRSDVWARLSPALDAIDAEHDRASLARWPWSRALLLAGAAALVTLAMGLVLLVPRGGNPPASAPGGASAVADPLDVQLDRYLQRSTPLVLALANRDEGADAAAFDAAAERRLARNLGRQGRDLAADLRQARRERDGDLVGDLAVVFVQLGNAPGDHYRSRVSLARDSIQRRGLLFELSLRELRRVGEGAPRQASLVHEEDPCPIA